MSETTPRNLVVSVRERLLNVAKARQEDFGLVLTKYGMERFLYRLSQSKYHDRFVLKGALLFEVWTERPHRPTRDIDLLGSQPATVAEMKKVFGEICAQSVQDDGLVFQQKSVRAERIREDQAYEGVRIRCQARLGNIRIPLQVDVGFGDAVTPGPITLRYPTLLDFPAPIIRAYPRETVVAEKFHAVVKLGVVNSRMKDFYDIGILSREFGFSGGVLAEAIAARFQRQRTELPVSIPPALSEEFFGNLGKMTQWRAFVGKSKLDAEGMGLEQVVEDLVEFLMPPVQARASGREFTMVWPARGPWKE